MLSIGIYIESNSILKVFFFQVEFNSQTYLSDSHTYLILIDIT